VQSQLESQWGFIYIFAQGRWEDGENIPYTWMLLTCLRIQRKSIYERQVSGTRGYTRTWNMTNVEFICSRNRTQYLESDDTMIWISIWKEIKVKSPYYIIYNKFQMDQWPKWKEILSISVDYMSILLMEKNLKQSRAPKTEATDKNFKCYISEAPNEQSRDKRSFI
jgi:hypothetical protein